MEGRGSWAPTSAEELLIVDGCWVSEDPGYGSYTPVDSSTPFCLYAAQIRFSGLILKDMKLGVGREIGDEYDQNTLYMYEILRN